MTDSVPREIRVTELVICEYYAHDCGGRVVCRAGIEKPECECGKIKEVRG